MSPTMGDRAETLRALNRILVVGVLDLLLFVALMVCVVTENESGVSVLGPIHGVGFLLLLYLTAKGAGEGRWGWWFPLVTLVTTGPPGSILGDLKIRRDLRA